MPGRLLGLVGRSHQPSSSSSKNALVNVTDLSRSSESLEKESKAVRRGSMDHINLNLKRKSVAARGSSNDRKKEKNAKERETRSPRMEPHRSAKLDMLVESPPLLFMGKPDQSTGALFSGQLRVDVVDPEVTLQSFEMVLLCTTKFKKPVAQNCPTCAKKEDELHKWTFVKESKKLKRGQHQFPFSYLFGGHLPGTTQGELASLEYHLVAIAKTSMGETLSYDKSLKLSRAIQPGNDKHSM
ncbi:hypothetical protein LTS18_000911, partial [Coniosporium uncinatum]